MTRPLLFADREDQLKAELRDVRRPQLRRLLEECERLRTLELPQEHPLASITWIGAGAANLALAYRLTGQEQYLQELRRYLVPALSFPHWGRANLPDHDLDAGWLCHGLGQAYTWAGDALSEGERTALREKLILQGTRLYDFAVGSEGGWWSVSYWQNHNWICYAGLATVGYALADEHPPAREWTERAKANFDTVLDMLTEDGSNNEGVVYWRYGVPWLVIYLDLLKQQEGIDWFARSAYLRETFWYRLYQAAPDLERIINHGDCHDRRSGHPVAMYYKLASEYRIPQCQWLADTVVDTFFWREAYESDVRPGVRAEAYQELLWFDPSAPSEDPYQLPASRYFTDLGLVVGRTSWDPDAVMVSFKASPGGGHKAWETSHRLKKETGWSTLNAGHHHPDAGTYTLLGYGAYLALDEGYSSRKKTEHHNAILVDGHGFVNEDRYHVYEDLPHEYTAEILTASVEGGWTHAVSETQAMYDRDLGVQRVRRHLVLTPRGNLVLLDDLRAAAPRVWTWLLQTENPAVEFGADQWIADAGSGRLIVRAIGEGEQVESVTTAIHANPTSSTPSLAIEKVQHTLRRSSPRATSAQFVSVLQPRPWFEAEPAEVEVTQAGSEITVTVTHRGVRETVTLDTELAEMGGEGVTGPGFRGHSVP